MERWQVTDVVFDVRDVIVSEAGRDEQGHLAPDALPTALQTALCDVVGDVEPEIVWRGSCGMSVTTLAGAAIISSSGRCCGCERDSPGFVVVTPAPRGDRDQTIPLRG
ncbi:MAG TPA: hypothetical protein VGF99_16865 [Myxococcota bacterium]